MATAKIQVLSDGSMRGQSFELTKETMSLGRSESLMSAVEEEV